MKNFIVIAIAGIMTMMMGCYVPMPSVGVKPTRVYHVKQCKHTFNGKVQCVHTQKWVKH